MKIARYRDHNGEHWGSVDLDAGTVRPIAGHFSGWAPIVTAVGPQVVQFEGDPVALSSVKLLKPLSPTSKIVGTGKNYGSHLMEDIERPEAMPCFFKAMTTMVDPDEEMAYPALSSRYDYEIELVAVIGSPRIEDPMYGTRSVLGYTIGVDGSVRDSDTAMFGHKGTDATAPLGPWITTKDELGGEGQVDLEMVLTINGAERQRDRTGRMLWNTDECIAWINARTSLGTGDVMFTGTCGGTAVDRNHREPGSGIYLEPGDVIECSIEGIGTLRNVIGKRSG